MSELTNVRRQYRSLVGYLSGYVTEFEQKLSDAEANVDLAVSQLRSASGAQGRIVTTFDAKIGTVETELRTALRILRSDLDSLSWLSGVAASRRDEVERWCRREDQEDEDLPLSVLSF